jgi:predicted nucleic acid-binding protein
MEFIDTNIFVRYLARDDPQKTQACQALFQKADRDEVALTTSESVIAEVVFVLASKRLYNVPRSQIRALLYPVLTIRALKLTHRKSYLRALDIFAASSLDFEDSLTIAHMERRNLIDLVSYDQGFDRLSVGGIARKEP